MKIAVLPGDGIGPEIIAQATLVLRKLNLSIEMKEAPVGGALTPVPLLPPPPLPGMVIFQDKPSLPSACSVPVFTHTCSFAV